MPRNRLKSPDHLLKREYVKDMTEHKTRAQRLAAQQAIADAFSGEAPHEPSALDRKLDKLIGPGDASRDMPGTLFVDADNNLIAFCSRPSKTKKLPDIAIRVLLGIPAVRRFLCHAASNN